MKVNDCLVEDLVRHEAEQEWLEFRENRFEPSRTRGACLGDLERGRDVGQEAGLLRVGRLSRNGITKNVDWLKAHGHVERVGGPRTGWWRVLK